MFKEGDRVVWTYEHHLNSKSTTLITKKGTYIKPLKKRYIGPGQLSVFEYCRVHFDGNKKPTTIREDLLKPFNP